MYDKVGHVGDITIFHSHLLGDKESTWKLLNLDFIALD